MMKRFFSLLLASLLFLSVFCITGCKGSQETSGVLRVCNCEDYIDESLLEDFTAETGIEVIYSTYGTNENLYNELVINPNSYDLVVPSEYMIEKLAEEGRLQKLDFTKLDVYNAGLSPYIKQRLDDLTFTVKDGAYKDEQVALSEFAVGYMWGTMGWVYNTDYVEKDEVSSWGGVFNNPTLSKKITIKDAVRDSYLVGLAMAYEEELNNAVTNEEITEILNNVQPEAIKRVGDKLNSIKHMLYGFEVDSGKNDIIFGNINAYVAWSGDAAYAIDVAMGDAENDDGTMVEVAVPLSYSIPDEGSNIWFDGFVRPSGSSSQNDEAVYAFLNFMSRPDSVYRNMNYTGYTSMIAGDGTEEIEVEYEDGTTETMSLFEAVVIDWFDESEDQDPETTYIDVDLSYFFGGAAGEYTVTVSEEAYGRLIAQYPTEDIVKRCAIMNNFSNKTLKQINGMWEAVKCLTFPTWMIVLFVALVVLLGVLIVLFKNLKSIKTFKLPKNKPTAMEKRGYKIIKIENIDN